MSSTVVLTLVVLCFLVEYGLACSCQPSHVQQQFCQADFVLKAKVKGEKILYQKYLDSDGNVSRTAVERVYFMRISRVFKTKERLIDEDHVNTNETDASLEPQANQTFNIASQVKIYTSYHGSVCGVTLKADVPTKYLLSGRIYNGQLYINMCDWHQEWNTLTAKQRKGVSYLYSKNCDCQIQQCWDRHCTKAKHTMNPDSCQLNPMDDRAKCYEKEAHCVRRKMTNKCLWSRGESWKTCDKKAREERFREP